MAKTLGHAITFTNYKYRGEWKKTISEIRKGEEIEYFTNNPLTAQDIEDSHLLTKAYLEEIKNCLKDTEDDLEQVKCRVAGTTKVLEMNGIDADFDEFFSSLAEVIDASPAYLDFKPVVIATVNRDDNLSHFLVEKTGLAEDEGPLNQDEHDILLML